jgi:hypothetical protein
MNTSINFNNIESIREYGFIGFKTIRDLMNDSSCLPKQKGVYLVIRDRYSQPNFLAIGSGGYFKNKNPNIEINQLHEEWVDDTIVIYIGKAGSATAKATLRSRLKQYLKFGQGSAVGHWGGRLIWQLEDSLNLIMCWKPLEYEDPQNIESKLIIDFKKQFNNKRPFANLKD